MHGGQPDPIVPNKLPGHRMDENAYLANERAKQQRATDEQAQLDTARSAALTTGNREPLYALRERINAQHEAEIRDFPRTSSIVPMEAIRRDALNQQTIANQTPVSPLDGVGLLAHLRGGFPKNVQVGGTAPPPSAGVLDGGSGK